jgi:hypothetical protein
MFLCGGMCNGSQHLEIRGCMHVVRMNVENIHSNKSSSYI